MTLLGDSPSHSAMFLAIPPTDQGGAGYVRYLDALRRVGDLTMLSDLDESGYDAAADRLDEVAARLEAAAAPAEAGPAGRRPDLPGRGHPLLPGFRITEVDETHAVALGTFSPLFTGWRAVHGGMIPVVLDEVYGLMIAVAAGEITRTAYLNVDFRSLTPVDEELRIEVELDRREGRKIFLRGRVLAGERLCAESDCLAVVVRA
jgi:acyl-coenzyme A thioesterase PaaI-like protein